MMVPVEYLGAGRITSQPGGRPSRPGSRPSRPAATVLADALAEFRGTATEFLEDLVREEIYADKLVQVETTAASPNRLSLEDGHPLTRRVTFLRGRRTSHTYLYAETLLVTSRLPWMTTRRLATSSDPIGRVIVEQGLTVARANLAPIPRPLERPLPKDVLAFIYTREYQIEIGGLPVMEISEWFLPSLEDFLVRQI